MELLHHIPNWVGPTLTLSGAVMWLADAERRGNPWALLLGLMLTAGFVASVMPA